ncbi:cobalt transporter CbiM [Spirochaetia bacterium]|nr:cobalt transporter CbiM [Spirochaetia bacterium]
MHISEGVLSPPVLAAGWGLAVGGLALGLKKTKTEDLPRCAMVSAVLFLASLVHVPLGPSSIHLTLLGLAGILLGWSAIPALFIALLLQGLLFQFGGLLSLGVNTVVMGTAAISAYGIYRICPKKLRFAAAFIAGFLALIIGSILVVTSLSLSNMNLMTAAALIFAANLPLAAVEGIITGFIVIFLAKAHPRAINFSGTS